MSFNLRYKEHTISVYEAMTNTDAVAKETLKYFYVPLMFPATDRVSKTWIWTARNGTEIRISLTTGNDEIEQLIQNHIVKINSTNPSRIKIAPMIINSLTAIIIDSNSSPIFGIYPYNFINPTEMVLTFQFQCTSAEHAKNIINNILSSDYHIKLAFRFTGLHTIIMNMTQIKGETLNAVLSKTKADGGNTKAQFIHRTQSTKFISNYMANVKKVLYAENPNADTQKMFDNLEDNFKTLMQQGKSTFFQALVHN